MKTVDQMLAPVMKLAGERETGSGNNTTVNKYWNAVGQAYCGYTVWYADKVSGAPYLLDGCTNPAYCRTLGEWLTAKGYRLTDNSKAQKGDIAFYCEYNEAEKRWMYQHVFFVYEKISGTKFVTLEGNTMVYTTPTQAKGSAVGTGAYEGIGYKLRNMPTGGTWQIFHLPYDGKKVPTKTAQNVSISLPVISFGDTGDSVEALQILLNGYGFDCGEVDGVWGENTDTAVLLYQRAQKISADKVCGKQTWTKLLA